MAKKQNEVDQIIKEIQSENQRTASGIESKKSELKLLQMAQDHITQTNQKYEAYEQELSSSMQARLKEQEDMLYSSKNFMDILDSKEGQVLQVTREKWKVLRNKRAEAFKQFFETNETPRGGKRSRETPRSKSLFQTLDRDLE